MNNARRNLSTRYLTALRAWLRPHAPNGTDGARRLGQVALAHGLGSLDVAAIHGRSWSTLASASDFFAGHEGAATRADQFLTQALVPIEAAHRATRQSNRQLSEHIVTLRRAARALSESKRELEREVARRRAAERASLRSQEEYRTLLLESQAMQKKLRQLTRQVLSAQEEERKHISRELHDEVVQTLAGINVELSALGRGTEVSLRTLKAKIARTRRVVENSVRAVHRFARELRPAVLDDLGLIPALHAYSQSLAARKKLKIVMSAFEGVETLGGAKRTVLFRVAQEALTNIARHAQATQVSLNISRVGSRLRMEVGDNGKSFDVKKAFLGTNPKRLGLLGMRERIEMIGGHFSIESSPGKGTTVRADVPFQSRRAKG